MTGQVQLGAGGTVYALRQLARRAGVEASFFREWKIEHGANETVVTPVAGSNKRIRFARRVNEIVPAEPPFPAARAYWMSAPPAQYRSLHEFTVPFERAKGCAPLFLMRSEDELVCELDILTSLLLVLSRYEETFPGPRDEHGRFPASQSVAELHGFSHRPVVDELGLAFEQALQTLLPAWKPAIRKLRVNLSHDIDKAGIPFDVRIAVSQLRRYRKPRAAVRDWLGVVMGVRPSSLECILQIASLSKEARLHSAVYWKASDRGPHDTGYDPRMPAISAVIRRIAADGVENGFHPGYATYDSPARLRAEAERLREVLGSQPLGGRQHFLRWSPHTWEHWEACGLQYDSTVGFAERIGFRAGTCYAYRPWLLDKQRECDIIELPLIAMDRTLAVYMGLRPEDAFAALTDCVRQCAMVGGVFTLLWHNTSLMDPILGDTYQKTLATLAGSPSFDCFAAWPDRYF